MPTVRPLHNHVLITPIEESDRTKGGLYKPENAKGKPTRGTVTAVGPGKRNDKGVRIEPEVKAGDVVHYPMFVGKELTIAGEDVVMIEENLILAIEQKETE